LEEAIGHITYVYDKLMGDPTLLQRTQIKKITGAKNVDENEQIFIIQNFFATRSIPTQESDKFTDKDDAHKSYVKR
jgi:hypothetical protein